jgi:hypothetical protein
VDGVDICFYDSATKFIQPVYRFAVTLHDNATSNGTSPTHLLGYLPVGKGSPETVPSINDPGFNSTSTPSDAPTLNPPSNTTVVTRNDVEIDLEPRALPNIRVGRYVVRDDDPDWVDNANSFYWALGNPFIWGAPPNFLIPTVANFLNTQYYWAYMSLFTDEKDIYINSVHVAEIEVHGNWHLFTTEKNCCEKVFLEDIPATVVDPVLAVWPTGSSIRAK